MASQLEQLLTCCICLDRFRNPKLLPCQHSVCMEPCMEGLVDYVRRQVKCPECRAEHRIPYNGVQGFPSNVTLQRFLEAHIEITGEAPDPFTGQIMERCGVCNEKNYLTVCAHCEKKICSDCKAAHSDILKREIGRINNQVKRASHRLDDQLSILQRNIQALKQNSDSVKEEIDNIDKRLQKATRDRCEFLRTEVISYYNTELRHLTLLKEGLEQEISNVDSNSELADKHMDDQTPWDDSELMDTKDIFLRTMEFIRSFDYDAGDYNRRARFITPDDLNKLTATLTTLGELVINNPKQTIDGFNTGGSGLQSGLMKSKSDHRLAAQFRDQEDSYGYSGRTSPVSRRRFGDRPPVVEEPYDSQSDIGRSRRFRSRFIRRDEDEERSVRFSDEEQQQQQQRVRPKVIDTEDVSRGPLSGIIRMVDAPRVIQRLQEKETNFKKKKDEPPKPAASPVVPKATPVTFGTPRKTNRQLSEDEIDKIKKQNKSETVASTTSTATATTLSTTSKPSFERVNSIKDTERSTRTDRTSTSPRSGTLSPSATTQEEEPSRKTSKDHGSSRFDFNSGSTSTTSRKSSIDNGASNKTNSYSRSSSTSSVGESGKSTGTKNSKAAENASTCGRTSRSNSTDSNKSTESSSKTTNPSHSTDELKSRHQKTPSVESKSTPTTRGAGASRYQSRFLPRAGTPSAENAKESGNEDEEEETSDDSESEESEETSEEEEEETVKIGYSRSSAGSVLGKSSAANRDNTAANDSGYGSSNSNNRYGSASSSSDSSTSYRKPSFMDSTKSVKEVNDDLEAKYPYASKFLNRSKTTTATEEENKPSFQSRFLSKSKSSAILGPDTNDEEAHIPSSTGSSRAKFEELKERRQRLARSKSSAGMDEDEPSSTTESSSYRNRYGRDSDSTTSSSSISSTRNTNTTTTAGAGTGSDDAPANQLSNWARYLKNKYGNKTGIAPSTSSTTSTTETSSLLSNKATSPPSRTSSALARSRSSHLLGLAKENDTSENDSKNVYATPTSQVADTLGPTPFGNIHRSQYLHKQRLIFKIGSRGSEPGNFTWPRGIAIGPDDSIVIADSSNHRVQVFNKEGNYLKDFGSYGNGEGEFDCLAGVAVNRIGQYIIADRYNHRIQIFDPSGMFLRSFGSQGSSDGKFLYPWGVTTDSLGFIYICDKENHRIQVFQSDGTFVGKFGSLGSKVGQLEHPHYIAVSSTNRVIVSDSNNHRIQIFDINGKVMTAFGSEGSEEGQFKFPRGVAVDEQGYIFVADSGNNRIQIFHPDGAFLRAFGCWGSGDGEFKGLEGVGVMSNGNVLICDRENHRIQVF